MRNRFLVLILTITFLFLLGTSAATAGVQEDLDQNSKATWSGDTNFTLRAGKTYYMQVSGARGGAGGSGYNWRWNTSVDAFRWEGWGGGTQPFNKRTLKIVVGEEDVDITIIYGNDGSKGTAGFTWSNGNGSNNTKNSGGAGGTGILGIPSTEGSAGTSSYGEYAGASGGGGGGGGASAIYFNNDVNQRIAINGTSGGNGYGGTGYYKDGDVRYRGAEAVVLEEV